MDLLIRQLGPDEIREALPLVKKLNHDISMEDLDQRLTEMLKEDYHCVGVFVDERCIAVAGYWIGHRFWSGKYLEIDNFIVDEEYREKGIGSNLVDWIEAMAREINCRFVVLDAYTTNRPSHRFYYRKGYEIWGFHFVKPGTKF